MDHKKRTSTSHKVLTVIGGVLCVVFGFMLICNLTIIIKGTIRPDKPPAVFGITPMAVLSGSMSGDAPDHIETGDLIFIGRAEPEALSTGDVIAFMANKTVVTHRIIGIETGADGKLLFTTKGDANNVEDQNPVSEEDLVGIFLFRLPKVGDFALFLQTPQGMILFVGVPLLAFILYDIIRRQHSANRERKKTTELEAELERLRSLAGERDPNKESDRFDLF